MADTPAFLNRANGQPNNSGEQDCTRMVGDGRWNDTGCNAAYPALCRYNP